MIGNPRVCDENRGVDVGLTRLMGASMDDGFGKIVHFGFWVNPTEARAFDMACEELGVSRSLALRTLFRTAAREKGGIRRFFPCISSQEDVDSNPNIPKVR